jgi:hypothetical protein
MGTLKNQNEKVVREKKIFAAFPLPKRTKLTNDSFPTLAGGRRGSVRQSRKLSTSTARSPSEGPPWYTARAQSDNRDRGIHGSTITTQEH